MLDRPEKTCEGSKLQLILSPVSETKKKVLKHWHQRVKILFNKKDTALIQMAEAQQAILVGVYPLMLLKTA
jgi:RNA recognition motif. (a.k.a. RRM, RBD, or RNP domain)